MNNKLRHIIALVLFTGAIFFTSCDLEDVDPMNEGLGRVTASINSSSFTANSISASLFVTETDTTFEVVATDNDDNIITLMVNSLQQISYDVNSANAVAEFNRNVGSSVSISENTTGGDIVISSVNEEAQIISGSFSFNTDNSTITNGEFANINYTIK